MSYNYVIKHLNRYASEIVWLLYDAHNELHKREVYVCSVGCGPASELYAVKAYLRHIEYDDDKIHFRGFDTQEENIWQSVWDETQRLFGDTVSFHNEDVFEYYREHNERVDLLIMNYMLSDLQKFQDNWKSFVRSILAFISNRPGMVVVINDVFSMQTHAILSNLHRSILKLPKERVALLKGFYFTPPNFTPYNFGTRRKGNRLLFQPSPEETPYDPFGCCNSIQLIFKIDA